MKQTVLTAMITVCACLARAGELANPSFELPMGAQEQGALWGEHGEIFGHASVIKVGEGAAPKSARNGVHMAQINVPAGSWNGIWQQLPWEEGASVRFKAHYLIQGGNLPGGVATFMKLEFFDVGGNQISAIEGKPHVNDTAGKWVEDTMEADTPPGTASVRFVMVAGENNNGEVVDGRIFWDLADVE